MKGKLIIGLEILAATAIVAGVTAFAAAGTEDDPLVSKSYVDDKIEQVLTIVNGGTVPSTDGGSTVTTTAGASFETVYLSVGQVLIGEEGTEIIMRSGSGSAYITGADGIVDATTGENLQNGSTLRTNHIMIVPRADGRGVKANEGAWFLVKGGYSVQ